MRIAFGVAALAGLAAVPLPWWAGRAPSPERDAPGVRERDVLRSP
ncbi:hypothetical protein [Actinomadura nitritigenes]